MTERDPEPGQAERPERAFRHFVRGTAPPDSPAYQQPGVVSVGQPRQPSPTEPTPPSQEQRKMRDLLESLGVKSVPPDDPIYSSGPSIVFGQPATPEEPD